MNTQTTTFNQPTLGQYPQSPKVGDKIHSNIDGKIVGFLAIALAVTIWAGFALSMRSMAMTTLTTADVALLRFIVPAVVLLAFVPSRLRALRSLSLSAATMVVIGAGLPFFFLAAAGAKATSATHVGALIAGTAPLSAVIVKRVLYGVGVSGKLVFSLAVIVFGIALMVAALPLREGSQMLAGIGALLLASLCWGFNTVGLQQMKTDAIGAAIVLVYPSLFTVVAMMGVGAVDSRLLQASFAEILPFAVVQGVAVGIVSTLAYSLAIQKLGSSLSATIGSLAPALACLMAIPLLGEIPNTTTIIAVVILLIGVMGASLTAKSATQTPPPHHKPSPITPYRG